MIYKVVHKNGCVRYAMTQCQVHHQCHFPSTDIPRFPLPHFPNLTLNRSITNLLLIAVPEKLKGLAT